MAETYDEKFAKASAIQEAMHLLTRLVLNDLPPQSRILCVGVGTGAEILSLSQVHPDWTFVGVDPSPDMLKVCERRLNKAGVMNRCKLITGYVQDVPKDEPYHAVLSVLVGHFVKRDERVDFLSQMRARLREDGYLVNIEISCDLDADDFHSRVKNWGEFQRMCGATSESLAKLPDQLRDILTVLPPLEVEKIFRDVGFDMPIRFFQAFMITGWWAQKKSAN